MRKIIFGLMLVMAFSVDALAYLVDVPVDMNNYSSSIIGGITFDLYYPKYMTPVETTVNSSILGTHMTNTSNSNKITFLLINVYGITSGRIVDFKFNSDSLNYIKDISIDNWNTISIDGLYVHTFHTTYDYTATPIPAAAYLLGSGLIGLIGLRRKEKQEV